MLKWCFRLIFHWISSNGKIHRAIWSQYHLIQRHFLKGTFPLFSCRTLVSLLSALFLGLFLIQWYSQELLSESWTRLWETLKKGTYKSSDKSLVPSEYGVLSIFRDSPIVVEVSECTSLLVHNHHYSVLKLSYNGTLSFCISYIGDACFGYKVS